MEPRMHNPVMVVPGAMDALQQLGAAVRSDGRLGDDARPRRVAGEPDQRLQRLSRHARPRDEVGR